MLQTPAQAVEVVVVPPAPADDVAKDEQDEAVLNQSVEDELFDREVNHDPMGEDLPPRLVDDSDDEDEDEGWNWRQVPIAPARKYVRRGTRMNEALKPVLVHDIPRFGGRKTGPINIPDCKTELDFFRLFWDDEILNTFVTSTNATIKSSNNPTATPVTVIDLFKLIACIIFMSIVSIPSSGPLKSPLLFILL